MANEVDSKNHGLGALTQWAQSGGSKCWKLGRRSSTLGLEPGEMHLSILDELGNSPSKPPAK